MKRWLLLPCLGLLLLGCGRPALKTPRTGIGNQRNPVTERVGMQVGSAEVQVEVRDDSAGRELGLSWRESMGEDEGMVFLFFKPQQLRFWMKGMAFPLDMIWIRDNKVIEISAQVPAPKSEAETPAIRQPQSLADTVLEVNAGWSERHGVEVGDQVKVEN